MIDGKRGGEARGRDIGKRARLRTVGGGIGGREDRSRGGRQAERHDEAKRFGASEWYRCSS